MNTFTVEPSDWHIWNRIELEKFLIQNQNQDIYLHIPEGSSCKETGLFDLLDLFDFKSVTIETYNTIEPDHPKYKILRSKFKFAYFKRVKTDPLEHIKFHQWNQHKVFLGFYGRPTWHRMGLAAHLKTYHNDKTLLNFRFDPLDDDTRNQFEIEQLFVNDPKSLITFANAMKEFPVKLETVDQYTKFPVSENNNSTDPNFFKTMETTKVFYPNILIDIVAETFVNGQTFFATEKTVRPMLLKKPFIVMAGKDHLVYLRQMGFKTFFEFWDEDYDGFAGALRYKKILEVVDDLSKKTTTELEKLYEDIQPILEHNFQLLMDQNYNTNIQLIND